MLPMTVLVERFSVVSGEHDQRPIVEVGPLEAFEKSSKFLIEVSDLPIVEVHEDLDFSGPGGGVVMVHLGHDVGYVGRAFAKFIQKFSRR